MSFCFIPECFLLPLFVYRSAWELGIPRRRLSRLSYLGHFLMLGYGVYYVYTFGMTFYTWLFYYCYYCAARGKILSGEGKWGSFGFAVWFHFYASEKGLGL